MRSIKEWYRYLRGDADVTSLRKRGLQIGGGCSIQPHCIIDPQHCWLISIGDNVTLAPRVHILAHDASTKRTLGYTKIGLVTIGDNVFIGAGSIILPGVSIGANTIIGAGSVVIKDVPGGVVAAGNPAEVIKDVGAYYGAEAENMASLPTFDASYTFSGGITPEMKNEMIGRLRKAGRRGYVR